MTKKITHRLFSLLLSFCCFFIISVFASCSNDEPEIFQTSGSLILDFADEKTTADTRLAVFIQTKSLPQRAENFTVDFKEKNWTWNVNKPGIYENNNKYYVFKEALFSPEGDIIPSGTYDVVYNDAAGNSLQSSFVINYDKKFLNATSEKAKELIENRIENFAVYDENDELLFMGKKKSSWKSNTDILREYKIGYKTRVCYSTANNSIVILMPAEYLKKDEN